MPEHNLATESVEIELSRYACPVCGRAAESLAAKKAHVRLKHPRPKKVRRG